MKAKDLMTRDVLKLDKDERLETVLELMRKNRVSKLVVTEKGKLAGIVCDGDVADELGAIKNRGIPASHLHASSAMRRKFPTAGPDTPLRDLLDHLTRDDAGLVPVVHDDQCVGVVTTSDLLHLVDGEAGKRPLSDVMTTKIHAVSSSDRVIHARRVMLDNHVERLPVLDNSKLVGILGEGDIARGLAHFKQTVADNHQPAAIQRFLVGDIMQRNVVTATPETIVVDAVRLMKSQDVGSLPVLRGDRLVGIVTRGDFLKLVKAG